MRRHWYSDWSRGQLRLLARTAMFVRSCSNAWAVERVNNKEQPERQLRLEDSWYRSRTLVTFVTYILAVITETSETCVNTVPSVVSH